MPRPRVSSFSELQKHPQSFLKLLSSRVAGVSDLVGLGGTENLHFHTCSGDDNAAGRRTAL